MQAPLSPTFVAEHRALMAELQACLLPEAGLDTERFDAFRRRALQHIAVEEKVLLPALERKLGRHVLLHNEMRRDHAGIAALCVPAPNRDWVESLVEQLAHHYRVEEAQDGFFAQCDTHLADEAPELLAAAAAFPPLQLGPFTEGRRVRDVLAEVMTAIGVHS